MSQKKDILRIIKEKGSITNKIAADELGCYRLSARIFDLREDGVPIVSNTETGVNRFGEEVRYARYSLRA